MARCVLAVEQAGPLTTIQDAGRRGHLRFGVTWSGPVDRAAFAAVQQALGNPADSPAVELSHGGITLRWPGRSEGGRRHCGSSASRPRVTNV